MLSSLIVRYCSWLMLSDPVILILVSKFLYWLCLKPQIGILLDLESWNIHFFATDLVRSALDKYSIGLLYFANRCISDCLVVTGNEVILFLCCCCCCWIDAVICVLYVLVGMYICLETLYWVFVFLPNLMWIMGKCCVLPCCLLQQILGTYIQIYSRERQTDRQIMDQLFWKS